MSEHQANGQERTVQSLSFCRTDSQSAMVGEHIGVRRKVMGSSPSSATFLLCSYRQVTWPLWSHISPIEQKQCIVAHWMVLKVQQSLLSTYNSAWTSDHLL